MKKKFLTLAMVATMVISSAFGAFAEDVDCTGWWTAHSQGYEVGVDGEDCVLQFESTTYEDATLNYNTPIVVVYAGDEAKVGGAGYTEYAVIRSDLYAWNAAANVNSNDVTDWEAAGYAMEKTGTPADEAAWAEWLAANKEGVDCTVRATKKDNKVFVEFTNNGVTSKTTIPVDASKTIYVSVSGEKCSITGIRGYMSPTTLLPEVDDNKPGDNTGDNKPGDNTGDNKPGDNTGDNKPGDNTGDNKPGDNTGDNKPGDNTGDNKPGDNTGDKTPSPDTKNVEATTITKEVANAVAEAAKVVSADGKALDVKLVVAPVEKAAEAAVTAMVKADEDLSKAGVKSLAVLDLKLMAGDKNITLLDGKIKVTIPMDKIFSEIAEKNVVAVYRVDKVNDKDVLSFLGKIPVTADKTITFATDHFSQYVFAVVEDEKALDGVKVVDYVKDVDTKAVPDGKIGELVKKDASVDDSKKPGTGDTTPVMPLVVLAVVALGGVVVVVASKKRA